MDLRIRILNKYLRIYNTAFWPALTPTKIKFDTSKISSIKYWAASEKAPHLCSERCFHRWRLDDGHGAQVGYTPLLILGYSIVPYVQVSIFIVLQLSKFKSSGHLPAVISLLVGKFFLHRTNFNKTNDFMKPAFCWSRGFCQANVLSIEERFLVPRDDIYFICDIYFCDIYLRIDRFERLKIRFICKFWSISLPLDPVSNLHSQRIRIWI